MKTSRLEALFHPQSIAVVGVSRDEQSVGSTIYKNIVADGYKGALFPVNPFITEFDGAICYPSVLSLPQPVDLGIIVVKAGLVASVLEEIGKKQISTAIVIASGFSETGNVGKKLEDEIEEIAKKYNIALLGPNCLGVIHPFDKLNASFARTKPIPGSIAFLSQSGALGTAFLDIVTPKGIGLSHFISLGNKADINELDCLEYLAADEKTSVIGMYVEQMKDANALIAFGKKMACSPAPKPIVVLKAGKTKKGTEAVHSHTGSLAGSREAYRALFKQAGFLETQSTQEFINTLVCFAQNPLPLINSCAVLTNAGGPAILATDALISSGVDVPNVGEFHNPIDLLGDAKASDYQRILTQLETDPTVGSILGIVTPQSVTEIQDTANAFCIHKKTSKKPIAVTWMGDQVMKEGRQLLDMGSVPVSKYPEQTAQMLANLHAYALLEKDCSVYPNLSRPSQTTYPELNSIDPLSLIKFFGITVPNYNIAQSIDTLPAFIQSLGASVAIKILSKDIIHKTDAGAVRLNVQKNQIEQVTQEMLEHIKSSQPSASIDGILCMDMVDASSGLECIIGIKKEPGLGTMLMLGMGGIFVEVTPDVTFRFAPISNVDAQNMIDELKSTALFNGVRGKPALDTNALIQALLSVSQLVQAYPTISELDINPLIVLPEGRGVIALDARVTTE